MAPLEYVIAEVTADASASPTYLVDTLLLLSVGVVLCDFWLASSDLLVYWAWHLLHTLTGVKPHPLHGTAIECELQLSQNPSPHALQWCFKSSGPNGLPQSRQD